MNPQAIVIAITAALGMGAGWHIQTLRYTAKEAEHEQQKLVAIQQSAAASIRWMDNTIQAQRAATSRAVALRRDLDSSRSELERLRDTLARPVPGTSAAADACPERTDPARQLLAACATELQAVAGAADRHASDAQALIEAWPK